MHGRTLGSVDRVRFGRALGYGTRHAAKTLAAAVDAATAPSTPASTSVSTPMEQLHATQAASPPAAQPAPVLPRNPQSVHSAPSGSVGVKSAGLQQGANSLHRSFWQPLAVFTGALWLRVTGVFFALLALTLGGGTWRAREALRPGVQSSGVSHFWLFAFFTLLFGYFAISSFVRATLKERRSTAPGVAGEANKGSAR